MPADEFADWQAYFQVEPFGIHGMEILMAQLCQAVIATSGTTPRNMSEYMPFVEHRARLVGAKILTGEELYQKAVGGAASASIRIVSDG